MKKIAATLLLALRVRPSWRFVRRQLREEPGVHEYELRRGRRRIFIRHDSDDPYVLAECFGRLGAYEPPREVAAALDANPPRRVVDLGANIGLFGLLALDRFPGCEVTGFEPDPANAELHERCIEINELRDRWRLKRAFAAVEAGKVSFAAGHSSRSRQAGGQGATAIKVDAVDAFLELQRADLIKIDIEGGEWALLGDPRFRDLTARAVVLEYHGNGCPGDDPRAAATEAVEGAGYRTHVIPAAGERSGDPFEGQGTLWGWRE